MTLRHAFNHYKSYNVRRLIPALANSWQLPLFSLSYKKLLVSTPTVALSSWKNMTASNNIKPTNIPAQRHELVQEIKICQRFRLIRAASNQSWPHAVSQQRVLVVFLPWLQAKPQHVAKYVQLYLDKGLDVLCVQSAPKDFLWPPCSESLAKQLTQSLQQLGHYDHFLFHAMSIGCYNVTTFRMLTDGCSQGAALAQKIRGVVYDSIVIGAGQGGAVSGSEQEDQGEAMDRFIRGIAGSISQSRLVLSLVSLTSRLYFALTKRHTLDFYQRAYEAVQDRPFPVPTLVLTSDNDPMCDSRVLEHVIGRWRYQHGLSVTLKAWPTSGHAQHLVLHRSDYLHTLGPFVDSLLRSLPPSGPQAVAAKL